MSDKKSIALLRVALMAMAASLCGALGAGCSDSHESEDDDVPARSTDDGRVADSTGDSDTGGDGGLLADTETDEAALSAWCEASPTEEECTAKEGCSPLHAWKVDLERDCHSQEASYVACQVLDDQLCSTTTGVALDPKTGECYVFSSLCFPKGWTVVDMSHPSCALVTSDLCPL